MENQIKNNVSLFNETTEKTKTKKPNSFTRLFKLLLNLLYNIFLLPASPIRITIFIIGFIMVKINPLKGFPFISKFIKNESLKKLFILLSVLVWYYINKFYFNG